MWATPVSVELTMTQRQAVTKKKVPEYRSADLAVKPRVLTNLWAGRGECPGEVLGGAAGNATTNHSHANSPRTILKL